MNIVCQKCTTIVWFEERTWKYYSPLSPDVSMCCMKGKVTLPYMIEPPPLLRSLFGGVHPRSNNFFVNIVSYNKLFSFKSVGGEIETRINRGLGPSHFVISDQNYHRIGSILPVEGERPKFCQLYIYDTKNELSNRLAHFRLYCRIVSFLLLNIYCSSFIVHCYSYFYFSKEILFFGISIGLLTLFDINMGLLE